MEKEKNQKQKQRELIVKIRIDENGEIIGRETLQDNTVEALEKKAPRGFIKAYEKYIEILVNQTTNKEKQLMWFLIKHRNQITNTIDLNNKKLRLKSGIQKGNFNRYIRKFTKLGLITETKTSRVFLINPQLCYNKDYQYMKDVDANWTVLTHDNSLMERLKISYQQENQKAYEAIIKLMQSNGITLKELTEICGKAYELQNNK